MYSNNKAINALLIFFAIILIALAIRAPVFFKLSNFSDIFLNTTTTAIGAMGMMLVLLTGEIDVSVGSILAAAATTTGYMAKAGFPPIIVAIGALTTGLILGTINGLVVTNLKLDSIVATLGLMSIYKGILILITSGKWITGLPSEVLAIGQGNILGIPTPIYIMLIAVVIMAVILNRTEWGRNLYAIGSNSRAAHLNGIDVKKMRIGAFAVNGMLVGLAGLILATRFGGFQSNTGNGWQMVVISAAVVGGVSTIGGEGSAIGALLGSLLISTLSTLLIFFGVDAYWEQAAQGLIILISVATYQINLPVRIRLKKEGKQ
jgi:ribose/xylose/arabinose/galactoside ABC-type transport system permease subunit